MYQQVGIAHLTVEYFVDTYGTMGAVQIQSNAADFIDIESKYLHCNFFNAVLKVSFSKKKLHKKHFLKITMNKDIKLQNKIFDTSFSYSDWYT